MLFRNGTKRRVLAKGAAILWLLLIIVEFGCPVLCCESRPEKQLKNDVSFNVATSSADASRSDSKSSNSEPEESSDKCLDECLCHTATIVMTNFEMVAPKKIDREFIRANEKLPTAPPQKLFHPPRSL